MNFSASAINYQENEDIFRTINNARQALFRMTSQLRTAKGVAHDAPDNECTMVTALDDNITYRYNNGDNKVYLDKNGDSYILCDNVTAMTCTKTWVIEDTLIKVKNVQISMTVVSGNVQKTISAAAVIRRNLN